MGKWTFSGVGAGEGYRLGDERIDEIRIFEAAVRSTPTSTRTETYPYIRSSTSATSLFSTTSASNPTSSISSATFASDHRSPLTSTKCSSYSTTPRSASNEICTEWMPGCFS